MMEFVVERKPLLDELNLACAITEKKTTMPALAYVHLRVDEDGQLHLFTTSLDVGVTTIVRGLQVVKPGVACVQAKKLLELVRSLGEGSIRFKLNKESILTITADPAVRVKLIGMDPQAFPALRKAPDVMVASMAAATWQGFVQHTTHAIAKMEERYTLNGAQLEYGQDNIRLVATDGHRLALLEQAADCPGDLVQALVPKQALIDSVKVVAGSERVYIALEHNHLFFRTDNDRVMFSRLLAGQFPNYRMILPSHDADRTAVVSREKALAALRRVALMVHEKDPHVNIVIAPDGLHIMGCADLGEAQDSVAITYAGDEYRVGFNPRYLVDVFDLVETETIQIGLRENVNGGMVEFLPVGETRWKEQHMVCPQNWTERAEDDTTGT